MIRKSGGFVNENLSSKILSIILKWGKNLFTYLKTSSLLSKSRSTRWPSEARGNGAFPYVGIPCNRWLIMASPFSSKTLRTTSSIFTSINFSLKNLVLKRSDVLGGSHKFIIHPIRFPYFPEFYFLARPHTLIIPHRVAGVKRNFKILNGHLKKFLIFGFSAQIVYITLSMFNNKLR